MAKHKRPPIPVIIVVVLALVAGGVWWWWVSTNPGEVAKAEVGGTVEATEYQVASLITARVAEVLVSEGDTVNADDVLVQLDTEALELQLKQAEQAVVAAEAAVTNAQDDGSKADVKAAKAKVEQANAQVELAKLQISYASVKAPAAGVVSEVIATVGQAAAPGRNLLTILDTSDLFVRGYVPETEIGNIKLGQSVQIQPDSGDAVAAEIEYISDTAEFTPNTVQTQDQRTKLVYQVRFRIEAAYAASGSLKPGMPVSISFE
ncbi:MAG: HlyD family efflux transporter periplasmic adaptor subunit [Propionibacteriaceae bacterium]|jgi:HlyD family secretion protein|nr:HlyD family efflux transporter periplasmic adaptor subunit [Propionibacteriaceae bacterium]